MRETLYAHWSDGSRQTLLEHTEHVGELSGALGARIGLSALCMLIGIFHDFGKAKEAFQDYLKMEEEAQRALRGRINHSAGGARWLWEQLPDDRLAAQLMALAVCAHHGGLPDCVRPDGRNGLLERLYPQKEIGYEECRENFLAECVSQEQVDALLQRASGELRQFEERLNAACADLRPIARLLFQGLTARFLLSCLLDADRYDTFCTQAGIRPKGEEPPGWEAVCRRVEERLAAIPCIHPVDRTRAEISGACRRAAELPTGVYQLYVPTGGGKTCSSFRFAVHHAKKWGKRHIFYFIPYTTIIDQNAQVVRELAGEELVLEHHSNLVRDNEQEDYKLLTERWGAPVILTTMVQFLETLYGGGTQAARRLHQLADSVLIFDEIQTLPLKCVHLFNAAVTFLNRVCGATVVLCTATQPRLEETPFPLRLSQPAQLVENFEEYFRELRRTQIVDVHRERSFNTQELAAFMLEKLKELRSGLVILNTKAAAAKLFSALQGGEFQLFYLSTRLCPAHRLEILREFRECEGKKLCVSTQLVEAGVDLSVDCVIRSLAGLDSIIQAAGRCNRHGETVRSPVYLVENREENLDRLPEIRNAQNACRRLLLEFDLDPGRFGEELTSPAAIARYYALYYYEQQSLMNYPVPRSASPELHRDTSLLDLLSRNTLGCNQLRDGDTEPPLSQAFETAGKLFRVIDSDTTGVLAPYGEGKKLIERLRNGGLELTEAQRLLREAQRYSVNLYEQELQALQRQGALEALPWGVQAVADGYYHPQLGVVAEKGEMEVEIY